MNKLPLLLGGYFAFILFTFIIIYVIRALTMYKLAEKAGLGHEAWLAWIPIFQTIIFFHIIDKSAWNFLWTFVPIVNIVFLIVWYIDFFERFEQHPLWLMTLLIPGLQIAFTILLTYMAFSENVRYVSSNHFQTNY